MANLLSIATGNLTAAATWGLCDATGSLVSSNTGVTTLTTGNLDSATFTPGAITVKGVALRLGSRASGSPTNTLTVTLRNSTDGLDVIAGTINVSDLPVTNTTDDQGGWFYLVFSAPQLLTAGKAYVVRVTLSATTTAVQLCTNGTANNWQRLLVTTTTQAPVAGDDLQVLGVLDGASNPATVSTITVTMNSTANTDYGSATTGSYRVAGLTISKGGTFAFGTAAATNYYFKLSGYVAVYSGGVLNVGTTGTPIPTGSMAVFELDPASDGQYKIEIRASGTVTAIGSPRTAGKAVSWTQLMADAAGGATTLTVQHDTGWKNGDTVGIYVTNVPADYETKILNGDAGASSLAITVGLSTARDIDAITGQYAEIVLITRNVEFRSATSTFAAILNVRNGGTAQFDWMSFRYFGHFGETGIIFVGPSGSWTMNHVLVYQSENFSVGLNSSNTALTGTIACDNLVFWGTSGNQTCRVWALDAGNQITMTNLMLLAPNTTQGALQILSGSNVNIDGSHIGGQFTGITFDTESLLSRVFSNLVVKGQASQGLVFQANMENISFVNCSFFHSRHGVYAQYWTRKISFTGCRFIQSGAWPTGGLTLGTTVELTIRNSVLASDTDIAIVNSCGLVVNHAYDLRIIDTTFGVQNGAAWPFTIGDIVANLAGGTIQGSLRNVTLGSTPSVTGSLGDKSYVVSERHNQTAGLHKAWSPYGTVTIETATFDVSPAVVLAPTSASNKLDTAANVLGRGFLIAVDAGQTPTFTARMKKSAAYNGNHPRIVLKAGPLTGTTDTVLATGSAVTDAAFSDVVGGLPTVSEKGIVEIVIDCDGTAGQLFVDTMTVTGAGVQAFGGFDYWFYGLPLVVLGGTTGIGGGGQHASVWLG